MTCMLEVDESEEKLKATGLWDSLRHEMAFRLEALAIGLDLEALSSSCLALLFPTWPACCGDAQDVRARWPTGVSRLRGSAFGSRELFGVTWIRGPIPCGVRRWAAMAVAWPLGGGGRAAGRRRGQPAAPAAASTGGRRARAGLGIERHHWAAGDGRRGRLKTSRSLLASAPNT